MKKIYLFSLAFLINSLSAMNIVQFKPDQTILSGMKEFAPATCGSVDPVPNIANFKQNKRRFIAKMDSFGLDRYFLFQNEEDAQALRDAVSRGGGRKVQWYYYDEKMSFISQLEPNIVFISGDDSDDEKAASSSTNN